MIGLVMTGGHELLNHPYVVCTVFFQRLEAVTRSPVFSQLSETLDGLVTIRAFKMQGK